jgi:nucleotide-binding universal stress UspA family protein
MARAVLGSTTAALLRESPVPVVVVPPSGTEIVTLQPGSATPHLGVLLVPVDLTAASVGQFEWAARLSAAPSHRILMLHVIPDAAGQEAAVERMSAAARAIDSLREFKLLVRVGTPAHEVLHVAKQDDMVGLVVLGRSSDEPGKLAYEPLRQDKAVVAIVP